MTQNTKTIVQLSAGFFVAIILHAVLTATLNRVPLPGLDLPKQAAVESFSFDTVESAISSPQRVNAAARDEVKKQICIPCRVPQLPVAQITPKPPTVESSQQNIKQYNLDLFIGNDYESQALQRWFNESKELVEFKGRCNFQVYTSNNALYKARYASIVPESQFPAVLFTKKDGGHIYVAGKAQLPPDAATLYSDIAESWKLFQSIQSPSRESSTALPTINQQPQDCVDGTCPVDDGSRKPLLPWRDGGASPLFPDRLPTQPIEMLGLFVRQQTGMSLESLAIIALVVVVVILVIKNRK
jgi:hypothetical protein